MRFRCAILDDYQNVALTMAEWSPLKDQIDISVFDKPFVSKADAIAALKDFHIVCAMRERTPFGRDVLESLPNLKLLLTSGMRNNSFDLASAKERGVTVCGTRTVGNPTVGLTIGLMLDLTRKIGFEAARMKAGEQWQVTVGEDVEGKTLGVVGLGNLGTKVAHAAKALGMNAIAWSQNLTPEKCAAAGVTYASKEELFATADVITIHLVLSDRSRGLIGRSDLLRMKPTSYLINTARAPIVDQDALFDVLKEKKIAGAGLDVFAQEPLPIDDRLRHLDNVVLTPHLGYVTQQNYRRYYSDMVENILAWLQSKPIRVMQA